MIVQHEVNLSPQKNKHFFIIAGEPSGDLLGAKLIAEIRSRLGSSALFAGIGGEMMEKEGMDSLYPLSHISIMGPLKILSKLPRFINYINQTSKFAQHWGSDIVIIIDSPDFTHAIAKKIRKKRPSIPIINYVSPSVWAWRSGRAKRMTKYIDHVLALLPFEPEVHRQLGGPQCTYIGHALCEKIEWISNLDPLSLKSRLEIPEHHPVLILLPGSRHSELSRFLYPLEKTAEIIYQMLNKQITFILPTIPPLRDAINEKLKKWIVPVHIVESEEDKFKAFRLASAALAASGTVTLELALSGTPSVVFYTVDWVASLFRFMLKAPSIVLANIIAGEIIYPEFIQEKATPQNMAQALIPLLSDTKERRLQKEKLLKIHEIMDTGSVAPSSLAADIVLKYI
ncbi:MAG: lipid-A-disaccharide synthase [Hyphomicrobium sp.]